MATFKASDLLDLFNLSESEEAEITFDPEDGSIHIDIVGLDMPTLIISGDAMIKTV